MLNYDYSDTRAYCEAHDLIFAEQMLPSPDATFKELKLTQKQVERIMREHVWAVNYLFKPESYTFKGRLMLAFYFLFGKKNGSKH